MIPGLQQVSRFKRRTSESSTAKQFLYLPFGKRRPTPSRSLLLRSLLAALTVAVLSALLAFNILPDKVPLHVGDISDQDVLAFRPARYIDQDATDVVRASAAERMDPVYVSRNYASSEADETVTELFDRLHRDRVLGLTNPERAARDLQQTVGVTVPHPALLTPLIADATGDFHVSQAERIMRDAVHMVMEDQIRADSSDDMVRARDALAARVDQSLLPKSLVPAVVALGSAVVRPNRYLDQAKTDAARESERLSIPTQYGQLFTGDVVVREGELVTPVTISKLRALGLQNPRVRPSYVITIIMLVAGLVALVILYMARFQKSHYQSTKTLSLLSLIAILSVLGLKVGDAFLGVRLSPVQFGFVDLACICAAAMLISSLISPRVALLSGALLSVIAELILGNGVGFAAIALISSMIATLAVSDIRSRHDLLRAALAICACNAFLCILVSELQPDLWSSITVTQTLTWAAGSGLVSVVAYYLGAALFERIFGIVTHLGLLELLDPNRPLLQKFCQTAPGTYTHSMMVGTLASTAADAVGADALLCRVGAYYHDLGKMKRPEFFIENQLGGENPHDKLTPSLSALIVTAHVKDGLEIAEGERLPPIIKSFIREHHGTALIQYFYHRQLNGGAPNPDSGLEQQFRYAGPKPQSRETAILMLADSVEAASRNLSKPTHARIEDLVDKIFSTHLRDGQLDESDLTLRDLRAIRDALVNLLVGMLHVRVDYPDLIKNTAGRTQNNGVIDQFGRFAESAPGSAKSIDPPSSSSSSN